MSTEMDVALGRMRSGLKAVDNAVQASNEATAEVARLVLLEQASKMEGLQGMTFESEYQYDDEGGYFQTASVYPVGVADDDPDYEFSDAMSGFGVEALATLCDEPIDAKEGQITIEQARAKRF